MANKKIQPLKRLKNTIALLKKRGKKIVFTNGCFDILHLGHVKYLEDSKKLGDILVVAVNSDSSVKKIKQKGRPINPQKERAGVLAALGSVDYITFFSDDTPLTTIKALRPDILVKGADWHISKIVGKDFVESCGGKVKTIRFLKGYSTTNIINKIKNI